MRKLLCLLLCISLACPFGLSYALAAETIVLFENDFETGTSVGDGVPVKEGAVNAWTSRVESATSTVKVASDATQGKVGYFSNTSTSNGGPRLQKTFYFDDTMTNMTVSYKARTVSASLALYLYFADGSTQSFASTNSTAWTSMRIEFDFAAGTYKTYKNNSLADSGKIQFDDISTLQLRFYTYLSAGKGVYLDDVVVTTTSPVDVEACNNISVGIRTPEEIIAPFASYPHAPAITAPAGKYEMFNYDCSLNANNGVSGGTDALWTGRSNAHAAILNADKTNDGKMIRLTNDVRKVNTGHLSKKLAVGTAVQEITSEQYVVLSDSEIYFQLRDKDGNILATTKDYAVSENTIGALKDSWNKVKAVFDVKNARSSVYVNDTLVASNIAFDTAFPAGTYEAFVYVYGKLAPADTMLLDNFVIYQDAQPVLDTVKYYGTTGTTWSLVANDVVLTEDSFVNNLRSHPRLMVNDRDVLLDKIATDPQIAAWYKSVKASADKALKSDVYTYSYGNGRNILDVARRIGSRLWYLSMAYLVEQDDAYVECAIREMRNAATFPDWSNNAPIIPSEIMLGFAGFYDWCYNSPLMTDEVKAEMVQIIKDQALWQFVRSYDGVISVEIARGTSNRTTVANSAAGLLALAIADEYPQLSQFLLDNALKYIMPSINVYGDDGAYPEGAMYWSYPMRTITPFLSSLQTSHVDGYALPDNAQWYFDNEALKNTNDYWAYISGSTGNFNFGDASLTLSATSAIYWHAQRTNNPFHGWYADYILAKKGSSVDSHFFAIPWYDVNFATYNDGTMPLDKTFNDKDTAQIASMRSSWSADRALYAAIQGGSNTTGHMFKSLGTFVIDANGQRFVCTIGSSNYSALYEPYMYYVQRAEGQNTIIANPGEDFDQKANAVARFVHHEEAENEAFTVLDMTDTNTDFTSAMRGMYMTPGRRSVVLQDEVTMQFPSELWWFAHTEANVVLAEDGKSAMLYMGKERMYVRITEGPEDAVLTVMDARPLPTSPVAPDESYRNFGKLAIHMEDIMQMTLAVEFIPLQDGEAAPSTFTPVKPIAEWSVSDNTIPVNRQAGANLVFLADSPNVLALEEKGMINAEKPSVVPFKKGDTYYLPAQYTAEAIYADAQVTDASVTVTRKAKTTTITEGIIKTGGVVFVPAKAMADALGMRLYTDESGLIALLDGPTNYTEATKAALRKQLGTRVLIANRDFIGFDIDKTNYELRYDTTIPYVKVNNGTKVTRSGDTATFVLDGTTYTLRFVQEAFKAASHNFALGLVPKASTTMGSSYVIENMTDGDTGGSTSGAAATISINPNSVTFEFEFPDAYTIDYIKLIDQQASSGSAMEKATWYAKTMDGEWVLLGVHEDLTAGKLNGSARTNVLEVGNGVAHSGLRVTMEDTDGVKARYFINELMIYGNRADSSVAPYTYTDWVEDENGLAFETNLVEMKQGGYVIAGLYKNGAQVGLKIIPFTTETKLTYTMEKADFDEVKVMVLADFLTMHILTESESVKR